MAYYAIYRLQLTFMEKTMEKTMEKAFNTEPYVKNTMPLTDREFFIMMGHDNDEISIDDLNFEKKTFNALSYCRIN